MAFCSLAGRTALVTGAASGIGFAVAQLFAEQGAAVKLLDLSPHALHAAVLKLNASSPSIEVVGIVCDVADEASVREAFETACRDGRLDVLVNNAGVSSVGTVEQTTGLPLLPAHSHLLQVTSEGFFQSLQVQSWIACTRSTSRVSTTA